MTDGGRSTYGALSLDELTQRPLREPIRCLRCGAEESFATPADAHEAGWDVAPYFTLQPVCPNCPLGSSAIEFLSSD